MRTLAVGVVVLAALVCLAPPAHAAKCPPDSVPVGTLCVDTYEASIWGIPATNVGLISRVKKGSATLADLTSGGATQLGAASVPDADCPSPYGANFPPTGNWIQPLYAASVPGVLPSSCITWFQAAQACRLSGKRLLTNLEWQDTAAGTPDGAPCIVTGGPGSAGTAGCVSNWGAFDMVGNVFEWVADWVPLSTACPGWGGFSDDRMCLAGADTMTIGPGALIRGGSWINGTLAGVFHVEDEGPQRSFGNVGLRCGRDLGRVLAP